MNQFTSHLDFSLTKKRFKMMLRQRSVYKSTFLSFLFMPVLSISLFLVCSDIETDREFHPMKNIIMDGVMYQADPVLYMKGGYVESEIMTSYFKRSNTINYDESGEPYSGIQEYIHSSTQKLAWRETYENGLHIHRVYLSQELIERNNASEIIIRYKGDEVKENILLDKDGAILSRVEIDESETRFYGQGNRLSTSYSTRTPESGFGYFKEWHTNGQLKFEMYSDSLSRNQGYMTLYDEEGNILEQERYKNGELVEKIK